MRFAFGAIVLLLAATAAGCSGGSNHRVVRLVEVGGNDKAVSAVSKPNTEGSEAPLSSVASLIPNPLPAARASCGALGMRGETVTISYTDGTSVAYGPKCLPEKIEWLGSAVIAEAAQWSNAPATNTVIAGAKPAERAELRRALAVIGPTPIERVQLAPARRSKTPELPTAGVAMTVSAGHSLLAEWQTGLLADLYNSAATIRGLRPIGWVQDDQGGGAISDSAGQPVIILAPTTRVIKAAGARIVELRRPAGAVELTIRSNHPAVFLKREGQRFLDALRKSQRNASVYFAVEDANGSVVYAAGWLPSEGMFYARPDLESCGPVMSLGPPIGVTDPPCPA